MAAVIDVTNPVQLRSACLRVIDKTYGNDVTQAFVDQWYEGTGDYTSEKYEHPAPDFDAYAAELLELDAELATGTTGD